MNTEYNTPNLLDELRGVIQNFLDDHQRISLNGLSKRCQVSEPTLRRIMSGKIKTTPTLTTVVDILSTISKEDRISELMKLYPGIIADTLKEGLSLVADEGSPYQYCPELNEVLRDEQRYLIFKLAANSCGVKRTRVKELFGLIGEQKLDDLIARDLVYEKLENGQPVAFTRVEGFSLSNDLFISHFKACANYIDTRVKPGDKNNLYYNFSESVNEAGRREILNIQRNALKKITGILNEDKYRGELPLFVLSAVDTLEPHLEDPTTLQ